MIPVSVIIMTKNEAANLPLALPPRIKHFDDIIVVDSDSTDGTIQIAKSVGARVENFKWNGQYPKKKQWCLDHIKTKHDWILMIDADEIVTDKFIHELYHLDFSHDGYFIKSDMVWCGRHLKFGQKNNKLCLHKKSCFHYPVIDDLDIQGGWEVEGHYQPIPINDIVTIGQIKSPIIHHDRKDNWQMRHDNYVMWEAEMTKREAFPSDPIIWREMVKTQLRSSYLRPITLFLYSYIFKLGFLDGFAGFDYARKRFNYTWRIVRAIRQTNGKR